MAPTCAGATGGVSLTQSVVGLPLLSPRMKALVMYILGLDQALRHTLVLTCRGSEPWEIETHVERRKIELRP